MRVQYSVHILIAFLIHLTSGSKILLIFSSVSKSHNVLGVKLAEGLIKRGHHVTFANPFPVQPTENLTHIHLKSISDFFTDKFAKKKDSSVLEPKKEGFFSVFDRMLGFLQKPNELFWEHEEIQKIIKDKPKYDVLITLTFFNDAILGLGPHLGVPTIIFNCIGTFVMFNNYAANPTMPYSTNIWAGRRPVGFLGRLITVTANFLMGGVTTHIIDRYNQGWLDQYLPNSPPIHELQKNVSVILTNSHVSIETARPYVPNMIQIGGFHVQEVKPLPEEYKKFLDGAKDGAILFSLGGNVQVSLIEEEKRNAIFKVLGELAPMRVVFKSEMVHENVPKNIMVRTWVPQADILAHPNTKLFISHGGMGGNTESVYHGVPILGIPFVGDQPLNMEQAQESGYARFIRPFDITEDSFRAILKEVLTNPKYTQNVKRRSAVMQEQPVKPMDNAAFWIEHVIKYGGGSHLQNPGVDLAWYQLYMLDIYVFYTVVLFFMLLLNYFGFKLLLRLVKKMFGKKESIRKSGKKVKKS